MPSGSDHWGYGHIYSGSLRKHTRDASKRTPCGPGSEPIGSSSVTSSRSADSASGRCVGTPRSQGNTVYGRGSSYSLAALRPSMQ